MGLTKFPNGLESFLVDSGAVKKTADFNIISPATIYDVATDGVVATLPAITTGQTVTIINTAEDGQAGISISPAAADGITYANSSTANKDLINTKATAKRGDFVTLASLDGVVAWQVTAARGIWVKEA
jgi:predicted ribosome-associated RNA-binding protein Tma20